MDNLHLKLPKKGFTLLLCMMVLSFPLLTIASSWYGEVPELEELEEEMNISRFPTPVQVSSGGWHSMTLVNSVTGQITIETHLPLGILIR
jgi:hypothetical protein